MKTDSLAKQFLHTYVSVDCVVFGFDGKMLNLLLVERAGADGSVSDLKLPGSLIYHEEDTDQAAERVLGELAGIKTMKLRQSKCYSSIDRVSNASDVNWLEYEYHHSIGRLITVAYLALTKIDRKLRAVSKYNSAVWTPVDRIGKMPFDHNTIVEQSLDEIRNWIDFEPAIVFELLPSKFTASQLRKLYEAIYRKPLDVRNFHKKIASLNYVIPLDEQQKNVPHRAARLYKFDRVAYKKRKNTI